MMQGNPRRYPIALGRGASGSIGPRSLRTAAAVAGLALLVGCGGPVSGVAVPLSSGVGPMLTTFSKLPVGVLTVTSTMSVTAQSTTPAPEPGVTSGEPGVPAPAPTTVVTTAVSSTPPATTRTTVGTAGKRATRTVTQEAFSTPSKNIHCFLGRINHGGVTCQVTVNSWPAGTFTDSHSAMCGGYPEDSNIIWMDGDSLPTRSDCFGDTGDVGYNTAVGYGTDVTYGDVSCDVEQAGVTCVSGTHGFTINRAAYKFW